MKSTKLIKLTEAAKEYGIPKTTFELAVRRQEINVYSFRDKDRYFMRSELDAWIHSKAVKPTPLLRAKNL